MFKIKKFTNCNILITQNNTYKLSNEITELYRYYDKIIECNSNKEKKLYGLTENKEVFNITKNKLLFTNVDNIYRIYRYLYIIINDKIFRVDPEYDELLLIYENVKGLICKNNFGYYINNDDRRIVIDVSIKHRILITDNYEIPEEILEIYFYKNYTLFIYTNKVVIDDPYYGYCNIYISKDLFNKCQGKTYYIVYSGKIELFTKNIIPIPDNVLNVCGKIPWLKIDFEDGLFKIDDELYDIYSFINTFNKKYNVLHFNLKNLSIDKQDIQDFIILEGSVYIKKQNKLFVCGKNKHLGIKSKKEYIDEMIDTGIEFPSIHNVKSARNI